MSETLWHTGANYTADAIVTTPNEEILLVKRRDNQRWAIPGGFVEPQDIDPEHTALRELAEETTLRLGQFGVLVYKGFVDSERNSDDRWIETSAYWYRIAGAQHVQGNDDAIDAQWHSLRQLPTPLHDSHHEILTRVFGL